MLMFTIINSYVITFRGRTFVINGWDADCMKVSYLFP